MAYPEESEGEIFTRGIRRRFYQIDAFSEFEMSRMVSVRGKNRNWATTQGRLIRSINGTQADIDLFIDRDLEDIFRAGMLSGADDNAYVLTAADKAALRRRRNRVRTTMERAKTEARRNIRGSWRKNKEYATQFPEKSRNKRALAVVYKDGRRQPYGKYMDSVVRTEAQSSYNLGVIRGAQTKGVGAFEVVDGPGCGLTSHDDGDIANGQILNADDCKRYLVAHPNCTRTFVPRPDLPAPDNRSSRLQAIRDRIQSELSAAQARDIAQINTNQILLDLALDADFRRFVFNGARQGVKTLSDMQNRIDDYLLRRTLAEVPLTEDELFDIASAQIDEFLESGEVSSMDDWLRFIISGGEDLNARQLQKVAGDFDYLREISIRADLTHRELNILNSIEQEYGSHILQQLNAIQPPGSRDDLREAYERFLERYLPNANPGGNSQRIANRVRGRIATRFLRDVVQENTTNKLAREINERLADLADAADNVQAFINARGIVSRGEVSFPRLGRYLNRADLFGARYTWTTRVIRAESTIVNKWRHLDRGNLIAEVLARGGSQYDLQQYLQGKKDTIFTAVVRKKTRQELIRWLGYRPGILHHFTINPQGMVRLGFRWDPAYGWKRPLPVLRVIPKDIPGARALRYEARLNRGKLAPGQANVMMQRRFDPETGLEIPRGEQNAVDFVDGIRIRSISQEISIATGGWANVNELGGFNLPTGLNPGIDRIGIRFKTVLNQINGENVVPLRNADDLALLYQNLSINDLIRQTQFMSTFAEFKAMGWSWMRIGKTLSLKPDEIAALARTFRVYFGPDYRRVARITTYMAQAQRAMTTNPNPEEAINLIAQAYAEQQKFRELKIVRNGFKFGLDVDPVRKQDLLARISNQAEVIYKRISDYYEGQGLTVAPLLEEATSPMHTQGWFAVYRELIETAYGRAGTNAEDIKKVTESWKEVFRTAWRAGITTSRDPRSWVEAVLKPLIGEGKVEELVTLLNKVTYIAQNRRMTWEVTDGTFRLRMGLDAQTIRSVETLDDAGLPIGVSPEGIRTVTPYGQARQVDLANVDPLTRKRLAEAFAKFEERFPGIASTITQIQFGGRSTVFIKGSEFHAAFAPADYVPPGYVDPSGIELSLGEKFIDGILYFNSRTRDNVKRMFKVGWYSTNDNAQHIEFHEFGHTVHHWINDVYRAKNGIRIPFRGDVVGSPGDDSADYWFPMRGWDLRDPERMRTVNPAAQILVDAILQHPNFPKGAAREALFRKYGDDFTFLVRSFLSKYQSTYSSASWKEAFAEAFAEGAIKGEKARPIARYIYQTVVALYDGYEDAVGSGEILEWDLEILLAGFRDGIRPIPREDL